VFQSCLCVDLPRTHPAASGRYKSGAPPSKTQFCGPCTKLHESKLLPLTQKHTAELDTAQKEVRRLKRQLDKGIEAKDLAERFLDREKELKAELDKCKQTLLAVNADLSQTKYLVKNKHDMNEKCKRQVKSMEQKCAEFDSIKARVEELEKSVMQVLQTLWLGVCASDYGCVHRIRWWPTWPRNTRPSFCAPSAPITWPAQTLRGSYLN
jgi:hypothetical protein